MGNTFFTSDTHFNHKNIIKYCNRPFATPKEMNEALVKNWNSIVGRKDEVWHLGDVTWGSFDLRELNGIKHLITGNHDEILKIKGFFETYHSYYELKGLLPNSRAIPLMHYPIESWNGKFHGALHLHGHTHGTLDNSGLLRFDVGVDCWNMKPVTIDEILKLVPKRKEEAEQMVVADNERLKEKYSARDSGFKTLNEVADHDNNRDS